MLKGNFRYAAIAGVLLFLAVIGVVADRARAAGPAFVQVVAATPQSNSTTVTVKYSKAQVAGDANILAIGWSDTSASISSVSDSKGNVYTVAAPMVRGSATSQAIYYAKNIVAAAANANTVTVTFNQPAFAVDLRASEYSGLDQSSPFDKTASGSGTSGNASTSSVTTTFNSELVFGAGTTYGAISAAGSGFTKRIITSPDADITEDKVVGSIGSYNATASNSGAWVMQVATFKAAGSAPDTTPPSVPAGLSANGVSQSQVNLSWTASTDNVGVTGYKVFRNGTQVGTPTGTSFSDTGLTAGTTYSYTVAASDAAGNVSAQSTAVNGTTQTPDTAPPSVPSGLSANGVSQTQVNLSWTASTDNVGVTGYKVFRNGRQVGTPSGTSFSDTGLTAGTTYSYTVSARDAAGNSSAQSAAVNGTTQAPDTTPPSVPAGLTANGVSQTQVNLSWTSSSDNVGVTGYNVFRNGVQIATPTTTTYQDTGLTSGTTYAYTVAAHDAAGNTSVQSTAVNGTTQAPDTTPPSVPIGLSANTFSMTEVDLSWVASTDNVGVTGYHVFRNGVQVGAPTGTSFSDTGLTAGTTYNYTVSAFDAAANESAQSSVVNGTTQAPDTTPPSVPAGVTVSGATTTTLTVSWTASTDNVGVTGYHIYRNGVQFGASTGTNFTDTGLAANTTYAYTVSAYDAATNESAQSVAVNGTTVALPATPFLSGSSANGRYTVDQNGNPFLINADTDWSLAWALNATDQNTFLADRVNDGFNTVLTDLVGNDLMSGHTNGANYAGDLPFTGGNFTPNPAYWAKIDTFFQEAAAKGITVFALPVDFYATQGSNTFANMTNAQALAFGQFLANRYPVSQYPGIVWMEGNDYGGEGEGCCNQGFVTQYQNLLTGLGTSRPTTIEQGFYESLSSDGATLGPLMSLNSAYDYHPTYEVILRGYAAKTIPVFFLEGAYENATTGFPSAPLDIRKQLGWTMTSGGTGSFYGNDTLWQFNSGWQSQLDSTIVLQRKALNAAFAGINWQNLHPDTTNQLVTAGRNSQLTARDTYQTSPATDDSTYGWYVTAGYSSDGKLGVIYNPDTTRNHITVSSSVLGTNPTITAVDPTNGARTNLGWTTTPTMGANAAGDHDWLFIITAN